MRHAIATVHPHEHHHLLLVASPKRGADLRRQPSPQVLDHRLAQRLHGGRVPDTVRNVARLGLAALTPAHHAAPEATRVRANHVLPATGLVLHLK
jgi:hypothetical protein